MNYILEFEDGTTFEGGFPENSGWNEVPLKRIVSFRYKINEERSIKFFGFEGYNHIVERAKILTTGQEKVTGLILMAKTENRVYRVFFDFVKFDIFQDKVFYGREYKDKPVSGWKAGFGTVPTIKIL